MLQWRMPLLSGDEAEILRGRVGTAEAEIEEIPRIAREHNTESWLRNELS
jgi:hypothetical protein